MSVKDSHKGTRIKYVGFWRRTRVRSFLYAFLVFPVYLLALALPKANHSVFGSFHGQAIGDNSLYAFLKIKDEKKFFITKSRESLHRTQFEGKSVYCFSPRGLWLQLTARTAYFSHSIEDFFAPSIMGSKVVALGHGVPMKMSAMADPKLIWIRKPLIKFVLLKFFPYLYHYYCNEVHSPSKFFDAYKLQVYGYTEPILVRSSMPRVQGKLSGQRFVRKILYAPTYRKYTPLHKTLIHAGLFDNSLQEALTRLNITLYVKAHYMDESELRTLAPPNSVELLFTDDISSRLNEFDAVITDYSSIFYDAYLQGLQVAFLSFDLQDYIENDTKLFAWYRELVEANGIQNLSLAVAQLALHGGVSLDTLLD